MSRRHALLHDVTPWRTVRYGGDLYHVRAEPDERSGRLYLSVWEDAEPDALGCLRHRRVEWVEGKPLAMVRWRRDLRLAPEVRAQLERAGAPELGLRASYSAPEQDDHRWRLLALTRVVIACAYPHLPVEGHPDGLVATPQSRCTAAEWVASAGPRLGLA